MQIVSRFAFLALTCGVIGLSQASNASADSADQRRSFTQVVSFGDSLSDVGTYAYARQFGGGAYTTNPGAISVQVIAEHYGSRLKPALTGDPNYATRANLSPNGNMDLLIEDTPVSTGATPAAGVTTGPSTTWLMATIVFRHA